VLIKFGTQ
jgi:hypothetical protein